PVAAVAAGPVRAAAPANVANAANAASHANNNAQLGSAMREEVWAIVRAAVEEAMGPLVARQRELEARVERAERAEREAAGRTASAASRLQSIPVAFGPSIAPPPVKVPPQAVPNFDAPPSPTNPNGTTIPDLKAAAPYQSGSTAIVSAAGGPKRSLPPSGYGVTVIADTRASLDLENVGPIDIEGFDGGRRKRRVAGFVVVLMLMIIAGAVTMTVLSHS
ncbi:MAG: Translation initiation factor 2, partial [Labilithrix sp.]|nr:Translation initiation factor 2 [Labilithrix sp.]